ncbi:MAG: S-layer homology domain-containing protein [Richelia sp. RM2_1_2]|nr:S-layer homology domain-containing protein [Richelia sp. SM2_1_7]NJM17843.1 S-layer homology domain-containing protein [Richelia sp. SM1_7_0]NJN09507.1 S-layer homology domain-containing protein [Richelia sp. RM1_1_1]NJO27226.1 S-layer homology domain-containing protein [Richelia sp. SL_2_1]NJO59563.1 S-layer homology domain-containing protein [Richelia sp. RM2_1_2]
MNNLGRLPIIGASIITLGLAIGGAIPLVSNAQTSPQSTFPDVPSDYWAQPFIRGLAERNIITGYPDGTYRPKQALERDEFAAIIRKAFDQDREKQIESGSVYKDVPQGYWASQAIEESVEQGFLSGDQNLFRPRQEVSKLEAINALTRGLDLNYQASVSPVTIIPPYTRRRAAANRRRKPLMLPIGITSLMQPLLIQRANAARTPSVTTDSQPTTTATAPLTPASIVQQAYKDADQIPENAVPQVAAATQSNIVVNYPNPNVLNPNQAISRGETAALVYQTMAAQGKVPQIDSNNPAAKYIVRVGENK